MKKILNILLLLCMFSFLNVTSMEPVYAASAKISVTGSRTVVVGNTVRVTFTVSSSAPLGSWVFDVKYDSKKLTYVSSTLEGSTRSVGVANNGNTKTKTYTMTFRTKSTGTATISVQNAEIVAWDTSTMSVSNGSININIITQKQLEDSYSSNNYLKSLSVDGYQLSPTFNKKTLEYSLELENDVRSIVVNAAKEDSKATLKGGGRYSLNEGSNDITLTVTAENGNAKNYVIHAIVKELNPIMVTLDGKEYSVIRKKDGLEIPSTFEETVTMVNGEEVPAFESAITGYRLIALKDEDGNIGFYIMNEDGTYTKYEEIMFGGIILYPKTPAEKDIPSGYEDKKVSLLGDKEITLYQSSKNTYPLVYGVNIETGKTNWYSYDAEEGTLQKFDNTRIEELSKEKNKFLFLIVVLSGSSLIIMIFLLILCGKVKRMKQKEESL